MTEVAALRTYLREVIGLGTDAVGLEHANAAINKGLDSIADLAELNADKGVKSMAANILKPGGTMPDPNWVDPGDGSPAPQVAKTGHSIPTICEQRLILAAYGAAIDESIGRTINSDALSRSRLKEFKEHREMVQNHTKAKDIDKVGKTFPVTKFLELLLTYLK